MSAIAEWYILPTVAIPGLNAVCQPTKAFLRAPVRNYDAFWDYLRTHAARGPGLDASGWVLNPLLLYLQEQHDVPVEAAETHALVATIAIDSFLVIEDAAASRWRAGLRDALDNPAAVEAYLREYYGDENLPTSEEIELHLRALRYLQDGLAKLTTGSLLLLSIG
jgi:hypothetical protein